VAGDNDLTEAKAEERKEEQKLHPVPPARGHLLSPTAPHLHQIETIAVVGERNTGTNFLSKLLERNFAGVNVTSQFCGWKHFLHDVHQCSPKEKEQVNTTLVVVLWKNAYDWLLSMHKNPYHMPMHYYNDFSDFIRRRKYV
jgi:hypothetical protein